MNNMKKARKILLIVLCVVLFLPGIDGYAISQKQKALNTYKKFLAQSKVYVLRKGSTYYDLVGSKYVTYNGTSPSKVKFGLSYIDNDNIPELVVETKIKYIECCGIFTYKNGKLRRIYSGTGAHFVGAYGKSGAFQIQFATDGDDLRKVYKLKGLKYSEICTYDKVTPWSVRYYIGRNKVSKAKFVTKRNSVTKKRAIVKTRYYSDTKANRKKWLK